MYQNLYHDSRTKTMHVWDDKRGYYKTKFEGTSFKRDSNGEYETLDGIRVRKVNNRKEEFENDVRIETQYILENYLGDTEPSTNHTILYFDIEVSMEEGDPTLKDEESGKMLGNEVVTSIAGKDSVTGDSWVYILDINNDLKDSSIVRRFDDEESLLIAFISKFQEINPTIITGWNIDGFDIPYLYSRIENVLGRRKLDGLSPINKVQWNPYTRRVQIAGVSSLDYLLLYKNFTYSELASYSLNYVSNLELGHGKVEYDGTLDDLFREDIDKFIEYNLTDVTLVEELNEKLDFINIAMSTCHTGYTVYEDFSMSSRYIDGAIIGYLREKKQVAPSKNKSESDNYEGAYVREPNPGLYDWVFSIDLQSLYPSLIRTINISPETKQGKIRNWNELDFVSGINKTEYGGDIIFEGKDKDINFESKEDLYEWITVNNYSVSSNGVVYSNETYGLLPSILTDWFDKRLEYKGKLKECKNTGDKEGIEYWDKRQLVQKILLNSVYGVLALSSFRFYDLDNAEGITLSGQTVIKFSEECLLRMYQKMTGKEGNPTVYQDTDSIYANGSMFLDNDEQLTVEETIEKVATLSAKLTDSINEYLKLLCKKQFHTDRCYLIFNREKIAQKGLFVAKKRYALRVRDNEGAKVDKLSFTGMDVVRSDFPMYFRTVMTEMLKMILHDETHDKVNKYLTKSYDKIDNVPIVELARGSAVKDISKYVKKQTHPFDQPKGTPVHVKSAMAYNDLIKMFGITNKFSTFKNGDKVKWTYLKNNKYGLETLAFDIYVMPKQIEEFVTKYIDRAKMWDKSFDGKVQDLYQILGWGKFDPAAEQAKEFFNF